MSTHVPRAIQAVSYERWAQEYLRHLPPEHFMESTDQGTQRAITLASLALVEARRRDFHVFNELLVQYPRRGQRKPGQVVPDNMVVITEEPLEARNSYNVPLEPALPYWVLEYVSPTNPRKDYEDSFFKYEHDLKVPYYLLFNPSKGALILYRHNQRRYVVVKPNAAGRFPLRKLKLEVALLDGWVRFWYEGELLPLPAELQRELNAARRQAADAEQRAAAERQRADALQQRLTAAERELAAARARLGHRL